MAPRKRSTNAYAPYGHSSADSLGFNGERRDLITGFYQLGTGYHRPFSPCLMRFVSPDHWSPFGLGGLNPYCYSHGDPVNFADPSGHMGQKKRGVSFQTAKKKAPKLGSEAGGNPQPRPEPSATGDGASARTFSPEGQKLRQHYGLGNQPLPKDSGWTLSHDEPRKQGVLNADQQKRFELFKFAIQDLGASPWDAAGFASLNIKRLKGTTKVSELQLQFGQQERVTMMLEERVVTIRQIGGHT